jgi:hypothetical protein
MLRTAARSVESTSPVVKRRYLRRRPAENLKGQTWGRCSGRARSTPVQGNARSYAARAPAGVLRARAQERIARRRYGSSRRGVWERKPRGRAIDLRRRRQWRRRGRTEGKSEHRQTIRCRRRRRPARGGLRSRDRTGHGPGSPLAPGAFHKRTPHAPSAAQVWRR